MAPSTSPSISDHTDDFFNQPVHRPKPNQTIRRGSDQDDTTNNVQSVDATNDSVPRPKRIACVLCRKRKLKCDGSKPSCGTCSRLGHDCEYDEVRKKSGPKRGYVKLLEARLKQVENLLENRDIGDTNPPNGNLNRAAEKPDSPNGNLPPITDERMQDIIQDQAFTDPTFGVMQDFGVSSSDDFSWEMIGLGLEEALPNQDIVDELNQIYFDKIHSSFPMIHRARFLAAMDLAPHMRPAVCLRYAMWTMACAVTSKWSAYTEHFYTRARKYAEQDEMRGQGEGVITLAHPQCWALLACHEFKHMHFPRAWMSIGRATRLVLMMGLYRQDRVGLDVKQTLPPPRDWTEREERRRTFWVCYIHDRYASIGTGWPMTLDEQDILTNLPASEEAFSKCHPEPTMALADVMNGDGISSISTFGGVVLLATLYGRNLHHLHRTNDKDLDHDLNGEFWKRHRALDNILLNISLSLPNHIRLPGGISDPNATFVNMNLHTATICLHQAAIFKADKNHLPGQIGAESKRRCIVAADQITNIMKMISHLDLSLMNPFLAFCIYIAARVFVQYLKSRRDDAAVKSSLHFLLSAMQVLKTKNPLTESFLVQLDIDLEGSGLDIPSSGSRYARNKFGIRVPSEIPVNTDTVNCSPLYEIRQSQNMFQSSQTSTPSWSGDQQQRKDTSSTNGYADLYTSLPQRTSQNSVPEPGLESVDRLYGATQPGLSTGISPNYLSGEDSVSKGQSNAHTPSTNSNGTSSYPTYSPPEAAGNMFYGTRNDQFSMDETNQNPSNNANHPSKFMSNWKPGNVDGVSQQQTSGNEQAQQPQPPPPPEMTFGTTGMTPGATGMTPLPDSVWSINDNNDWMYGWPGSPPQPQ